MAERNETMADGTGTALVVIDVQNAVVANAWDRDGVVSRIASLVDRARTEGCPVVFVQHEEDEDDMRRGSDGWQLVPELVPAEGEPVVAKTYPDSFVETELAATLERLGAGHLVLAGAQTDACIRSTFHRAMIEGYDVTLVSDCHTTDDRAFQGVAISGEQIVTHMNLYAHFTSYPGRVPTVTTHDAVTLGTGREQMAEV
jgi:nicotinamidase-related amidase